MDTGNVSLGEGGSHPFHVGRTMRWLDVPPCLPAMTPPAPDPNAVASVAFRIKGGDFNLEARVLVPAGVARTGDLLPLAQGLSDRVVQVPALRCLGIPSTGVWGK